MIQVTPQMRIRVAVEPVDFRKGIDGLACLCRVALGSDPFSGAILHRKNAYFYKTQNGARVGDLFMSLIHTCELNKVNPFEYLTELQKHASELSSDPDSWMPWNYRHTLQRADAT